MLILPEDFDSNYTQDEVDSIVNALALNAEQFSEIACLDGRFFGVKTACDECEINYSECLRRALIGSLIGVQGVTERELGYPLTERYITETVSWRGERKIQTKYPGIVAVNVGPSYLRIAEDAAVSPYIIQDVDLEDSGDGYCLAIVPASIVKNPSKIRFYDNNGDIYPVEDFPGFPRRGAEGTWEIPISKVTEPCASATEINVQHCNMISVDVILEEPCEGIAFYPVYPGTHQYIPQSRAYEMIDADTVRFWFDVWSLIDPEFMREGMDWERNEYYKLIPTIDVVCVSEETTYPSIRVNDGDCASCFIEYATQTNDEDNEYVRIDILDAQRGILSVQYNNCGCGICGGELFNCGCNHPIQLTFTYKVSPKVLQLNINLVDIRTAMAYLIAAELPTAACGCEIPKGNFIYNAQQAYTEIRINPVSGEEIINLKYGRLHGQYVYTERMLRAKHVYFKVTLV